MAVAASAETRISVQQGASLIPLVPREPTLSSANAPWHGLLLERHAHGPHGCAEHEHPTYFVCVHLSQPARLAWRSEGKSGNKIFAPSDIVVLSQGTRDEVTFQQPVERILLTIEPSFMRQAAAEQDNGRDIEFIDQWGVPDRQVASIASALAADAEAGFPSGRLFGEYLGNALAVHLQQKYAATPSRVITARGGLPPARLNRAVEYIAANLGKDIRLADLAAEADMSPHYFAEMFKQSTGASPHQFMLRRRIEVARQLLADPKVSVLEAAIRTGFADQSHFARIFRRIVGVPPSRYRAQI